MRFLQGVHFLRESEPTYSKPAILRLTNGRLVVLDQEDFLALRAWNWHFMPGRNRSNPNYGYAARYARKNEPYPGRLILMHRIIMETPPHLVCDHINGDPLDNRRANLRNVTQSQNLKNRAAFGRARGSHKGVSFNPSKGKWCAKVHLYFDTEEEAIAMYQRINAVTHGEFERNACSTAPAPLSEEEKFQRFEEIRRERQTMADLMDDCL